MDMKKDLELKAKMVVKKIKAASGLEPDSVEYDEEKAEMMIQYGNLGGFSIEHSQYPPIGSHDETEFEGAAISIANNMLVILGIGEKHPLDFWLPDGDELGIYVFFNRETRKYTIYDKGELFDWLWLTGSIDAEDQESKELFKAHALKYKLEIIAEEILAVRYKEFRLSIGVEDFKLKLQQMIKALDTRKKRSG